MGKAFQLFRPVLFNEVVSEAVDLVCKIDELHVALFIVGCGGVIELNSAKLKVVNGAINVVGLNTDVTVSAGALFVHKLKLGGGEDGLAANLALEGEDVLESVSRVSGGVA